MIDILNLKIYNSAQPASQVRVCDIGGVNVIQQGINAYAEPYIKFEHRDFSKPLRATYDGQYWQCDLFDQNATM